MKTTLRHLTTNVLAALFLLAILMTERPGYAVTGIADTMASSTSMIFSDTVNNRLDSRSDEDWYRLVVSENGYFTVSFGPNETSAASDIKTGWNIQVMTSERNIIWNDTCVKTTVNTINLPMAPGTYYIRIYSPYTVSAASYMLRVLFTQNDLWITDRYNVTTTKHIELNQTYYGSMLNKNDVDIFQFDIEKNGYFQVSLGPANLDNKYLNGGWYCAILDENGNALCQKLYIKQNTTTIPLSMVPGTYSVKVYAPYTENHATYAVKVNFVENDLWITDHYSAVTSKNIGFGTTYYGRMLHGKDQDNFMITIPEEGYVKFHFGPITNGNDSGINNGWNYTILDLAGNRIASDSCVRTVITTSPIYVKSGTYTFKVTSPYYAVSTAIYSISADFTAKPKASLHQTAYTYTGGEIRPEPIVMQSGRMMIRGIDYTVAYSNNINRGIAALRVAYTNSFLGTDVIYYSIAKAPQNMTVFTKEITVKYSKLSKKQQTIKMDKVFNINNIHGNLSFRKVAGNPKIKIGSKNGTLIVKKGIKRGPYKVRVRVNAEGNRNFKPAHKTVVVRIVIK